MSYFISLFLTLALTFSLCYLCKRKFEIMFAVSAFSIIIFLYLFGLLELLLVGVWLAFSLILAIFIAILIKIVVKKEKFIINLFFTKISIIFLAFSLIQFPVLYFAKPYIYDELSHWAIVVKNMFFFNDLGTGEFSTDMFKAYPRATSLFLYFFQFFGRTFQEGQLYMAMNLLNVGMMLPVFSIFERKVNRNSFLLCLISVFALPVVFFPIFYRWLYADHFLGVIFAYGLFVYFKDRKLNLFTIINLSLTFAIMIMTKNTGIVIALFVVLVILIDLIICKRDALKEFFTKKWRTLYLLLPVIAIVFVKVSWSLYIDANLQQQVWDTKEFSISALFKYMFSPSSFQKAVNNNFGLQIVDITSIIRSGLGYLNWAPLITFIVIGLLLFLLYKKYSDKKFIITLSISFAMCLAFYLYGLLVTYVFTFNEYEALTGASFYRYYNSLPFGVILFLIYQIFNVHLKYEAKEEKYYVRNRNLLFAGSTFFIVVLLIFLPVFNSFILKDFVKPFDRYQSFCKTLDYKVDSVYYINVYNDKQTMKRARYYSTPVDSCGLKNGGSFGDGTMNIPEAWGDPFIENTTYEQLEQKLSNEYNYLYLHYIDGNFIEKFGSLFERREDIQEDRFYSTQLIDGKLIISLLKY